MLKFFSWISLFLVSLAGAVFNCYVFMKLWNWFPASYFKLPDISFWMAMAFGLTGSIIRINSINAPISSDGFRATIKSLADHIKECSTLSFGIPKWEDPTLSESVLWTTTIKGLICSAIGLGYGYVIHTYALGS